MQIRSKFSIHFFSYYYFIFLFITFGKNSFAGSEIYVCIDAKGTRTYQNTAPDEGCRKLGGEPVLSVPTLPTSPPAGAFINTPQNQSQTRNDSNYSKGNHGSVKSSGLGDTAPPQYLDQGAVARDNDRRRILENELRQEEARLQDLQNRYQTTPTPQLQTEIARSNSSLEALRREISKIRK